MWKIELKNKAYEWAREPNIWWWFDLRSSRNVEVESSNQQNREFPIVAEPNIHTCMKCDDLMWTNKQHANLIISSGIWRDWVKFETFSSQILNFVSTRRDRKMNKIFVNNIPTVSQLFRDILFICLHTDFSSTLLRSSLNVNNIQRFSQLPKLSSLIFRTIQGSMSFSELFRFVFILLLIFLLFTYSNCSIFSPKTYLCSLLLLITDFSSLIQMSWVETKIVWVKWLKFLSIRFR